jgi:ABC-type oligopeptide transport system ATPase subunit
LSVVRYIADRIAVMENGKIVELGDSEEVFQNPQSDCAKMLLSAIPKIQF